VNLYERSRKLNNSNCKSYFLSVGSVASNDIVNSYFIKFPLYSSKRLDFVDWNLIRNKVIQNTKPNNLVLVEQCTTIKAGINSKRTDFNWNHLKNFTF